MSRCQSNLKIVTALLAIATLAPAIIPLSLARAQVNRSGASGIQRIYGRSTVLRPRQPLNTQIHNFTPPSIGASATPSEPSEPFTTVLPPTIDLPTAAQPAAAEPASSIPGVSSTASDPSPGIQQLLRSLDSGIYSIPSTSPTTSSPSSGAIAP